LKARVGENQGRGAAQTTEGGFKKKGYENEKKIKGRRKGVVAGQAHQGEKKGNGVAGG